MGSLHLPPERFAFTHCEKLSSEQEQPPLVQSSNGNCAAEHSTQVWPEEGFALLEPEHSWHTAPPLQIPKLTGVHSCAAAVGNCFTQVDQRVQRTLPALQCCDTARAV